MFSSTSVQHKPTGKLHATTVVGIFCASVITAGSALAQQGAVSNASDPRLQRFFKLQGIGERQQPSVATASLKPAISSISQLTHQDSTVAADAAFISHGSALPALGAAPATTPGATDMAHMFCYMTCHPALNVPYCGTAPATPAPPNCTMVSDSDFLRSVAGRPSGVGSSPFVDPENPPSRDVAPAGYTFLGQFIDHDLTRTAVDLGRDAALAAAAPVIARKMAASGFSRERILQIVPDAVRIALTSAAPAATAATPSPTLAPPSLNSGFLDLDSMYGVEGYDQLKDPSVNAYPGDFEKDSAGNFTGRFALRHVTSPTGEALQVPIDSFDFIRNATGAPIIPDPRNNENRILAQLQALFMAAHNDCIDTLTSPTAQRFNDCQRLVRWMYQTIVVTDYLPRIVDPATLDVIAQTGGGPPETTKLPSGPDVINLPVYSCKAGNRSTAQIGIPLEFTVAAFRLGHSQVRETYRLHQQVYNPQGELLAGEVRPIFSAPDGVSNAPGVSATGLEAVNPLPSRDVIDWSFFFDIDGMTEQQGRPLDALIVERLYEMPVAALPPGNDPVTGKDTPDERDLARRNLLRSAGPNTRLPGAVGLATGEEALARAAAAIPGFDGNVSGVTGLLSQRLSAQGFSPDDFRKQIPLWLWVLAEAEVGQQSRLGRLGTHIVAEFIMGSLKCDQTSVVNQPATLPGPAAQWGPTNDITRNHRYAMYDLIKYLQRHYKFDNSSLVFSSR